MTSRVQAFQNLGSSPSGLRPLNSKSPGLVRVFEPSSRRAAQRERLIETAGPRRPLLILSLSSSTFHLYLCTCETSPVFRRETTHTALMSSKRQHASLAGSSQPPAKRRIFVKPTKVTSTVRYVASQACCVFPY